MIIFELLMVWSRVCFGRRDFSKQKCITVWVYTKSQKQSFNVSYFHDFAL